MFKIDLYINAIRELNLTTLLELPAALEDYYWTDDEEKGVIADALMDLLVYQFSQSDLSVVDMTRLQCFVLVQEKTQALSFGQHAANFNLTLQAISFALALKKEGLRLQCDDDHRDALCEYMNSCADHMKLAINKHAPKYSQQIFTPKNPKHLLSDKKVKRLIKRVKALDKMRALLTTYQLTEDNARFKSSAQRSRLQTAIEARSLVDNRLTLDKSSYNQLAHKLNSLRHNTVKRTSDLLTAWPRGKLLDQLVEPNLLADLIPEDAFEYDCNCTLYSNLKARGA